MVAFAAILVVGVAVGACSRSLATAIPHPARWVAPKRRVGGLGRTAGVPFAFGLAVGGNSGEESVVLERIEPVGATPGLRVLETRVSGPDREFLYVAATREWPSKEFTDLHRGGGSRSLRVQRLPVNAESSRVRLRADKPGRYVIKGVAVEYTVDGKRHRAIIRNGLGVCVTPPGEPTIRGCDAPRDL